jgi:hypothetical protein
MNRSFIFLFSVLLFSCKPDPELSVVTNELQAKPFKLSCEVAISDWQDVLPPSSMSWEYTLANQLVISGIVVSSDSEGAFYRSLIIAEEKGYRTLELLIDQADTALNYPRGSRVLINLSALSFKRRQTQIQVGVYSESFGNEALAPIPLVEITQKLLRCGSIEPIPIVIDDFSSLETLWPNTLVKLNEVMFRQTEVGVPLVSSAKEPGLRIIENCQGQELNLLYSGYEDFASEVIPQGSGSIIGLTVNANSGGIQVAHWGDIDLKNQRCTPASTDDAALFISEIADPDNESKARFIELYNNESYAFSLSGWSLLRYTNDSVEVSHVLDLSSLTIEAKSTLVIAADVLIFEALYGFSPHLEAKSNSAANSNGDDNMVLVNPSGELVDIFGVIGVDGTGTAHEFEDGRALRKPFVKRGNSVFEPSEWIITNDTGGEGTIKQTAIAPDDFSPNEHLVE